MAESPTMTALKEKGDTKTATAAKKAASDVLASTANEIENLTKTKALSMAKKLIEEEGLNDFRLGGVLSTINANGYWQDGDHESFKAFLADVYGIPYRKAMYLVGIYNGLIESGVEWSKVKDLGWTKLKELANIMTPDDVDEWVERAKDMTVIQLQEYIKSLKEGDKDGDKQDEEPKSTTTTMTFKVHADQKEVITSAVETAKEKAGTEFPAVALEHICMAYIEGGLGAKSSGGADLKTLMQSASVDEVLEVFEQVFPEVNLTVEM